MIEELSLDRKDSGFDGHKQKELVKKYCYGIEERITKAGAEEEAKRIVNNACVGLEKECASSVIRSQLEKYIRGLYEQKWKRK